MEKFFFFFNKNISLMMSSSTGEDISETANFSVPWFSLLNLTIYF